MLLFFRVVASKDATMEYESPLHEIAALAATIAGDDGYKKATGEYQRQLRLLQSLRDEPDDGPNGHHSLKVERENFRSLQGACRDYLEMLRQLTQLIHEELPNVALAFDVLERPPRHWHDVPLDQWRPLRDALKAAEVAAIQASRAVADAKAAGLTAQLGVRAPNGDLGVLGVTEIAPQADGAGKGAVAKTMRWTQRQADAQIQRHLDEHREAFVAAQSRRPGAVNAFKSVFGRNKIAKKFRMAGATVGNSSVWREVALEFGWERSRVGKAQKEGLEIALEKRADQDGDSTDRAVTQRETERMIMGASLKPDHRQSLLDGLRSGRHTDDQVREILDTLR
ncbi:MAG TPA: hypothetical protein VL175_12570 [Pirellulales bacterium]|nr:hypothetical protein [Pirellulales bacterium]